jgi:D-hexose-6-phosphate mutarotase
VVWNPWAEKAAAMVDLGDPAWRGMVCVETGNIADNEVRLAAHDEHYLVFKGPPSKCAFNGVKTESVAHR